MSRKITPAHSHHVRGTWHSELDRIAHRTAGVDDGTLFVIDALKIQLPPAEKAFRRGLYEAAELLLSLTI